MKGLLYLYQRTIINRIKKALKRPLTYMMGFFLLLYFVMIYYSFHMLIQYKTFKPKS